MPLADYTKCRLTELYNTMNKKLKIKFWKTEKALSMQVIEQEGLPKCKTIKGAVRISLTPCLFYEAGEIYLRGQDTEFDYAISSAHFTFNEERDAFFAKITNAITDELFTGEGELKVGEMCEVRKHEYEEWEIRKLLAILPKGYKERFIVKVFYGTGWDSFEYARPRCKRTEPKVEEDGEIVTYTWEEK